MKKKIVYQIISLSKQIQILGFYFCILFKNVLMLLITVYDVNEIVFS